MKKFKMPLLWAIFITIVSFACSDISDPLEEVNNTTLSKDSTDYYKVVDFVFAKGKYDLVEGGRPSVNYEYAIDECAVGDNVILKCLIDVFSSYGRYVPDIPIVAKITSRGTGNIRYISFLEQGNLYYPEGGQFWYICQLHLSDVGGEGDVLKVSPDGDILIVEILNSDPKIIRELTVKSKFEVDSIDYYKVVCFEFARGKYDLVEGGLPSVSYEYAIDECAVGENVILKCLIDVYGRYIPDIPIVAKITSRGTGNTKYISFLEQGNLYYSAVAPIARWYVYQLHLSAVGGEGDVLKVSPNGDILIVEILNSDPKIIRELTVKSKLEVDSPGYYKYKVVFFKFAKGKYDLVDEGYASVNEEYAINECAVGDNVILKCEIDSSTYPGRLPIVAKITSHKTGDIKYISFLKEWNIFFPKTPIVPYVCQLHLSDVGGEGDVLKVSPDGDILIVEMLYSYPKQIIKINCKEQIK